MESDGDSLHSNPSTRAPSLAYDPYVQPRRELPLPLDSDDDSYSDSDSDWSIGNRDGEARLAQLRPGVIWKLVQHHRLPSPMPINCATLPLKEERDRRVELIVIVSNEEYLGGEAMREVTTICGVNRVTCVGPDNSFTMARLDSAVHGEEGMNYCFEQITTMYGGEETLILPDFFGQLKFTSLLNLIDAMRLGLVLLEIPTLDEPGTQPYRGITLPWKRVIIVAPRPPVLWPFRHASGEFEARQSFLTRVDRTIELSDLGPSAPRGHRRNPLTGERNVYVDGVTEYDPEDHTLDLLAH